MVHLSDIAVFDVAKMVVQKMEKGFAIRLFGADQLFLATTTLYIWKDLNSDQEVELVVEEVEEDE
jgi:hypothetical protein